jgi:hypothetical protein
VHLEKTKKQKYWDAHAAITLAPSLPGRCTHESPWLKLKGRLKRVKGEWAFSSWDYFGRAFRTMIGKGNNVRPRYKKADEDRTVVYRECRRSGWKQRKHAIHALRRVCKLDDGGAFDRNDSYGHKCQRVRHEFRVVKVHYVNQVSVECVVTKRS